MTVYTREALPEDWAMVQSNLGGTYRDRIQGSRAENLEASIKAYEAALTVYTREALPEDWAMVQSNLGGTYRDRIQGSRTVNIEAAIKAFEAALTVYTRQAFPQYWAETQDNLGEAYRNRIQGSRAENLEAAIKAYEAALTVFTREAFPQNWATTQDNLGLAYRDRIQGSRAENLEAAIKASEAALTVYTREAFPQYWAETQHDLGSAYRDRIQGSRAENLQKAADTYEAALTVYTVTAFPRDHLEASRDLAWVLLERHDWARARTVLSSARDAFFLLFGEGVDETEARDVIAKAGSLFADLAYTEAEAGDTKAALATLSEGRAHLLAAALRQQTVGFTAAEDIARRSLVLEIGEWAKLAEAKGTEGAEALSHLSAARGKLEALLKEASRRNKAEFSIDAILRQGLLGDAAIVAPIVTHWGSKFLIVTAAADGGAAIAVAELPELTSDALQDLLRHTGEGGQSTGWQVSYELQQTAPAAWLAAIEAASARSSGPCSRASSTRL